MPDPTPPSPTQHPAEWAERAAAASTATGHTVGCTCARCEQLRATQHPGQAVDLDEVRRRVEAVSDRPTSRFMVNVLAVSGDPQSKADLDFISHCRDDIRALLADLDAAREALRRVEQERDELKVKLDRPCGECHPCTEWAAETWKRAGLPLPHLITWQDKLAEVNRMRPVVEEARALVAEFRSGRLPIPRALHAAVDTYETQEGTDAG